MKKNVLYLIILFLVLALVYTNLPQTDPTPLPVEPNTPDSVVVDTPAPEQTNQVSQLDKDGHYTSRDDVARYLFTYGELPQNYYTKNQARDLGWVAEDGNLWEVTDQGSIGGDRFQNREKHLPEKQGRVWYECDIDYSGGYRGPKRIVYSNDGLIYYTDDHYESFEEIHEEDL